MWKKAVFVAISGKGRFEGGSVVEGGYQIMTRQIRLLRLEWNGICVGILMSVMKFRFLVPFYVRV